MVKNTPASAGDTSQSQIEDDPTCHRATGPVHSTIEPVLCLGTTPPSSHILEPVLCNKRNHHNEKPVYCNWRVAPAHATREKSGSNEDPGQPKRKRKKKETPGQVEGGSRRERQ